MWIVTNFNKKKHHSSFTRLKIFKILNSNKYKVKEFIIIIKNIINYTNFIIFKEFLSDTITSFREKIETYFEDDKAIIIKF